MAFTSAKQLLSKEVHSALPPSCSRPHRQRHCKASRPDAPDALPAKVGASAREYGTKLGFPEVPGGKAMAGAGARAWTVGNEPAHISGFGLKFILGLPSLQSNRLDVAMINGHAGVIEGAPEVKLVVLLLEMAGGKE